MKYINTAVDDLRLKLEQARSDLELSQARVWLLERQLESARRLQFEETAKVELKPAAAAPQTKQSSVVTTAAPPAGSLWPKSESRVLAQRFDVPEHVADDAETVPLVTCVAREGTRIGLPPLRPPASPDGGLEDTLQ